MLESLEADGSAFPGAEGSAFGMGRGPCDKACARHHGRKPQELLRRMRRLYRRAGRSQGSRRRAKRKTGYHGEVHGSIQPPERFSPGNAGIRDAGHQEKEIKFVALLHLCRTGWGVRGVQTEAAVEAVGRVPGMTL